MGTNGSPYLGFLDGKNQTRAQLQLADDSSPNLTLYDDKARIREGMGLLADGSALIQLYDDSGMLIWQAPPVPK
jgi:hypothetical protein